MDGQRVYLVKRKAVVRVGFEMDSAKAADSVLEKGAEIVALEQRPNAAGIVRVRFAKGWTSHTTSTGLVVLEERPSSRYVCKRRSVIRVGFEMDSEKAGTLEKGARKAGLGQ